MTFLAIMIDMISYTFIYPVFSTHLEQNFGLSTESSSYFFVITLGSYFCILQLINKLNERLGIKLTIGLAFLVNRFLFYLFVQCLFYLKAII